MVPYEFNVPLPVRASEILDFTPQEWACLDGSGMATYDPPPAQVGQAFDIKKRHERRLPNGCFCLATAQLHSDAILLTGARLHRRVAEDNGINAHGVLWVVDQLLRVALRSRAARNSAEALEGRQGRRLTQSAHR